MSGRQLVIVGAGYTGKRLVRSARDDGWRVAGTGETEATVETLAELGAEACRWDALSGDASSIGELVEPEAAVIYSVPTLFREYDDAGELARHVRPVADALRAASDAGAARFVYLSSSSVYGDHGGEWVDEEIDPTPSAPNGKMRRDIEQFVLREGPARGLDADVARLVGIYGPGRTLIDYMRSGRYRLVGGGTKPTNRIHVDDIVRGLRGILERGPEGARIYNLSDGDPKTAREVVDWAVARLGVDRPEEISVEAYAEQRGDNAVARWTNTYRVDNSRMVEDLGVEPTYEDVFAGYRAIYGVD